MALYKLSNRRPVAGVSVKVPRAIYDRIRDLLEKGKLQSMGEAAALFYDELVSTIVVQENKIEDLNKKIEELTKENEESKEYIETLEGIVAEEEKKSTEEMLKK